MYIIQYGELALKWKNRIDFENKLKKNIESKLAKLSILTNTDEETTFKVQKKYGKFILDTRDVRVEDILIKTPGIHHFARAEVAALDIESMKKIIDSVISHLPGKEESFKSFRITTQRTNKGFPMKSMEISRELWAYVYQKYKISVDLYTPEKIFYVNIAEKNAYIYSEKVLGVWGLPIGSSGRVVSLLSGGIDSPVASFRMMKRGCEVIAVHAYAKSIHPEKVKEKVLKLAQKLVWFQNKLQVYLIPYGNIQREIVQWTSEKYRMLLFKRSIVRMANRVAKHVGAKVLTMWDAVGQVASQTLENIQCAHDASELPILSPLIAYDKEEIIDLAKQIWTYEISILPHEDCCSLIAWEKPWTKWRICVLKKIEEEIMIDVVEEKAWKDVERVIVENSYS